jgi:integrase
MPDADIRSFTVVLRALGLADGAAPVFDPAMEYADEHCRRLRHCDLPSAFADDFANIERRLTWIVAANSRKAYLPVIRNYWSFCVRYQLDRYQAASAAIYLYSLAFPRMRYLQRPPAERQCGRGERPGIGRATVQTYYYAIEKSFTVAERVPPNAQPKFQDWLTGLLRRLGEPKDRKTPLLRDDLRRAVDLARAQADHHPLAAARDAALLLLGWSCALRRSELAAVRFEHLVQGPAGWQLLIPHSKTDQQADGQVVPLYPAADPAYDPLLTCQAWRDLAGFVDGPLFRPIRHGRVLSQALTSESVRLLVRKYGGLPNAAGHSLRAGFATQAAIDGQADFRIQVVTRHASRQSLDQYIRPIERFRHGPGSLL